MVRNTMRASSVPMLFVSLMAAWLGASSAGGPLFARTQHLRQISSIDGKDLYLAYCSQCHGREGKGDGPRAKELAKEVPDLTRIAARNGGEFNKTKLQRFISGEDRPGVSRLDTKTGKVVILTKDGRDPMPDWGFLFRAMWPDQPVQLRVSNIVRYLEKIQVRD